LPLPRKYISAKKHKNGLFLCKEPYVSLKEICVFKQMPQRKQPPFAAAAQVDIRKRYKSGVCLRKETYVSVKEICIFKKVLPRKYCYCYCRVDGNVCVCV